MATGWADRQKSKKVRLELTWFANRSTWKKKYEDQVHYFKYPNTKEGYEAALRDWQIKKSKLSGTRKNADIFDRHREKFESVRNWYDQFGTPSEERVIREQVDAFLTWLEVLYQEPELPDFLPFLAFTRTNLREEFYDMFVDPQKAGYTTFGSIHFQLSNLWIDRLDRMTASGNSKEPQTIAYWIEKYVSRVQKRGGRFITVKSAEDRRHKLKHFSNYSDGFAHIKSIDEHYVEEYHANLDTHVSAHTDAELRKDTKIDYFAVFRMFVRWCAQQSTCELIAPANLDSKEFGFREPKGTGRVRQAKKLQLWSKEEFLNAIEVLPRPYPAYLLLMLNCGFRHVDISQLRWSDLHLSECRIVIQRNKLNQQASAPVISYKLFDKTVKLIEETMSIDPVYVFANQKGGRVEGSIKSWWTRNAEKHGFKGKRLDYIRKTGATLISKHDHNLDDMYLGETLSSTAKIHYSFRDGEPCKQLDDGVAQLGAEFDFCESPVKQISLTKEVLAELERAGVDMTKLR